MRRFDGIYRDEVGNRGHHALCAAVSIFNPLLGHFVKTSRSPFPTEDDLPIYIKQTALDITLFLSSLLKLMANRPMHAGYKSCDMKESCHHIACSVLLHALLRLSRALLNGVNRESF
jgi:hypothetical protein